mmetsp:Transcript_3077/g.4681  ORF Transcript_3077/g.4681 Transcript_3077/m.4681 type:complete len:182 (-) Transcript_3077:33-578(-)
MVTTKQQQSRSSFVPSTHPQYIEPINCVSSESGSSTISPSPIREPQLIIGETRPWHIIRREHKAFFAMASSLALNTPQGYIFGDKSKSKISPHFTEKHHELLSELGHELNISTQLIEAFLGPKQSDLDPIKRIEIIDSSNSIEIKYEEIEDPVDLNIHSLAEVLKKQLPTPKGDQSCPSNF